MANKPAIEINDAALIQSAAVAMPFNTGWINGRHDGLIDKKRVKQFIKTEEDLIFEQDESEEDWSDL